MNRTLGHGALAGALLAATPAAAQSAPDLASELAALRAQVDTLNARISEMERTVAPAPATAVDPVPPKPPVPPVPAAPVAEIGFRGAPRFTAPGGWSFKPRGRLQFDAGYVSSPEGIADRGLGFASELRRARLGVEGTVPGGFGYKFEVDFANNEVEFADVLLSYAASDKFGLVVGQHNNFQSLEEITSSRFTSFLERAAFTDAFNFERRVGLSGSFKQGDILVSAGVFTDSISDLRNDENDAFSVDGRVVYGPKSGDTQLHFGASAHRRDNGGPNGAGEATRFRQRPLLHTTDTRFIGTPSLAITGETNYGLEAAMIRGPFHAAGEVHWLTADRRDPATSPTFFGGYAELGYFLTGETRGYRLGEFDRTRVLKPVGGGGFGAVEVNVRYDRLDLSDSGVLGGTQDGYLASLIWIPQDYVRFLLNYGHLRYDDAAIAAAGGRRDYSVDVIGARAQIDF